MNAKELYLAIGQIDDELILEANEQPAGKRRQVIRRWALAAAACVCLVAGGVCLQLFSTSVIWNAGRAETVSKASIPEQSVMQPLTPEELPDYYQLALPETLDGDLFRVDGGPALYTDGQGLVLYDRNVICYESADGTKSVSLTLSRVSGVQQEQAGAASRIRGVPVVLTQDDSIPGYVLLGAAWEQRGTTVRLSAEGLEQAELVSVLKELIRR